MEQKPFFEMSDIKTYRGIDYVIIHKKVYLVYFKPYNYEQNLWRPRRTKKYIVLLPVYSIDNAIAKTNFNISKTLEQ